MLLGSGRGAVPGVEAVERARAEGRELVDLLLLACALFCGHGARVLWARLKLAPSRGSLGYDDEVLLACSCSVVEIQTSRITNRWYRFWCRVGIFLMQCAGQMMTQHLITIKKVAGPRPGAVRLATSSLSDSDSSSLGSTT